MTLHRLDLWLVLLALCLGVVGARRAQSAVATARIPEPVVGRAASLPDARDADSLAEELANIIDNDVFRLANQPSPVPFLLDPPHNVERREPPKPVRPVLTLRAIMGGPPWIAVIDGLPGQATGTTVRSGDSFEKVVIRSVGRDTVVVQAPDTTWKLTISRHP